MHYTSGVQLKTTEIVSMSHDKLRTVPDYENIDNDLNIFFEILGVYRNSKRKLKTKTGIYNSEDQFLKIWIEIEKNTNHRKQSLRIAKDLLEEELAKLTLDKDVVPDLAGFIVVCIGISLLYYADMSGVIIDTITKRFPVLVSLAGALILLFKFYFNFLINRKINRLKRCLMVVNQVIDRIEEDEKISSLSMGKS